MPRISIITPSYNQAAFLEQTIQSVLAQDYPSLEYIIVDGNSNDGSLQVIHKYVQHLAWWVSEPDSGQAEAINKGMRRASGEYIAWLNSDDLYLPGAVAAAVEALDANPAVGMVFGDAVTIDEHGLQLNRLTFGDWGLDELVGFCIICQPSVFMRREVCQEAGSLDPSYHYLLDHHLWLRIARLAPIRHVPSTWAAARHHAGAKNVSHASGFGQEAFRILEWMRCQPDLELLIEPKRRRVEAGAYRLNARYLLDGGQPGPALHSYLQALWRSPAFTLKHWRRILYATVIVLGGKSLADSFNRRRMQTR